MDQVGFPSLASMPAATWEELTRKRIYFGHKSVGDNIIAGVRDVMQEQPQIKLRIVQSDNAKDFVEPIFGHSHVGMNGDPRSKLCAFAALMDSELGERVDIALLKFCYIDINSDTDVDALFSDYEKTVNRLEEAHPDMAFVHATVPLTVRSTGVKSRIKRFLGQPDENVARCQFNRLLRRAYSGRAPLFDLAQREATTPAGREAGYDAQRIRVSNLVPAYTDDGGHLNAVGRRLAAEALLCTFGGVVHAGAP